MRCETRGPILHARSGAGLDYEVEQRCVVWARASIVIRQPLRPSGSGPSDALYRLARWERGKWYYISLEHINIYAFNWISGYVNSS